MGASAAQTVRFGEFEVFARIGVGGMGEVFRARVVGGDDARDLALKLIRPEHAADPRFRRMFLAEAQVGARLRHPNVVRLLRYGQNENALFLAMELVDGVTLSQLLARGPLPPSLAAHVAVEILAGLHYAHDLAGEDGHPLQLVHRDVSAANVLLSRAGEVKVTDFGVVKVKGLSLTAANEIKGKRDYMAPEQLAGGAAVDRRTDVFAVGVLLFRMVVGRPAFTDIADWLAGNARVDDGGPLATVIGRAMSREPRERYDSAAAFADAISATLAPPPDAGAQLGARVAAVLTQERSIDPLERLILAQLGDRPTATPLPEPSSFDWQATPVATAPRGLTPDSGAITLDRPLAESQANTLPHARMAGAAPASWWLGTRPAYVAGAIVVLFVAVVALVALSAGGARSADVPSPAAEAVATPPAAPPVEPRVSALPPAPAPKAEEPAVEPRVVEKRPVTRPVPAPKLAAAPRPAAPPRPPGFLTLTTEPWATAYLGARRLGVTPFAHLALPAGRHQLDLDLRDGGQRRKLSVKIDAGEETRVATTLR